MWRRLRKALPAISLIAIVYYADSWGLAIPIVAVTAWLGGITAFLILTPIYLLFDYSLGRLTLRLVVDEDQTKDYGLVMRFVRRWFNTFSSVIPSTKRKLSSKNRLLLRTVGFGAASYFGGAFLTVPVMYLLGQRRLLRVIGLISAAIYAITFVAQYALGTSIFLIVVRHIAHWL